MTESPQLPDAFRKFFQQKERKERIVDAALTKYIDELLGFKTNIIRGILVARPTEESPAQLHAYNGYMWNILTSDWDPHVPDGESAHDYYTLGEAVTRLQVQLRRAGIIVYVSNVEHSKIEQCKHELGKRMMNIVEHYFY